MKSGVRRSRREGQRGAELLEVTLIIVPLFGLMFLLLDLAMVIFERSTFQEAVREGVRYAITGQNTTGPCVDDSIKAVAQKYALGFLRNTGTPPTYSGPSATLHVHWINPVTGAVANNAAGNIIEVSVEGYVYGPMAPYQRLGMPAQLWARAYDVMQATPGGLPCISNSE
jgi:Flp pilus assembly protein TadG